MNERWTPAYGRLFRPDHGFGDDPACQRFAWLDLCHMAQYEDGVRVWRGEVVPLKRGELLASLRFLADRWGWSVKKVRTYLTFLQHPEIAKMGTVRDTRAGTVYRIAKYDTYANPGHSEGHTGGTDGAQTGHKEQQVTSIKTNTISSGVRAVFDHWREVSGHTRCQLTPDRKAKIATRLKSYSVDELKQAIEAGCADPFYRGENRDGKRYDFPETLLKNDSTVDKFLNAPAPTGKTPHRPRDTVDYIPGHEAVSW